MAKEYPLVEELQNNFIATDNIQRDDKLERSILTHAKASLLLEHLPKTKFLRSFFKHNCLKPGRDCYLLPLEEPIVVTHYNGVDKRDFIFKNFEVHTRDIPKKDPFGQTGRWRLEIYEDYYGNHMSTTEIIWRSLPTSPKALLVTTPIIIGNNVFWADFDFKKIINDALAKFSQKTNFELCQHLTTRNTPEEVCCFLKRYKLDDLSLYQREFDCLSDSNASQDFEEACSNYPTCNERDIVESLLENFIFKPIRKNGLGKENDKHYTPIEQIYSYVDECCQVKMKVVKLFRQENQKKILIPITNWDPINYYEKQYHCVPLSGKQILYHLDLIKKESPSKIIITDSIEIAEVNQENAPEDTVWTSFLCEHEQYDQIDWEPLEEVKEVFLLITNHSNINLAEVYVKAHKLASFLREKIKLELKFIQIQVDFHDSQNFYFKLDSDIKTHKPLIIPDSVFIMDSFDEFERYHEKAVESLQKRQRQFWEKENSDCGVIEQRDSEDNSKKAIDFVFRPVILRGKVTIGHAPTGQGKTRFFLSMCASIVAGSKFIHGRSWNTVKGSTGGSGSQSGYKYRKVLYLDFESTRDDIASMRKDFVDPYMSGENQEKIKSNFIIEALGHEIINYSEKDHHPKIHNIIDDAAKNKGEKGQPIDLVVFDTYTSFVKNDYANVWNKIEPLLKKITEQGIAILLIAHTHEDDKEVTGSIKKIHMCESEIKLYRENGRDDTLQDPMFVKMGKTRFIQTNQEKEGFYIYLKKNKKNKNHKWCLWGTENEKLTEDGVNEEELKDFVITSEEYIYKGFKRQAICQMLGIEKTTYTDRRKKFEEKFGDIKKYI